MQAYTAVNAKTTLSHPSSLPVQPAQPSNKTKWPQQVRDYVSRAFMVDRMIPGIDHTQMSEKLKQVISQAADTNTVDSIDWTTYPLPQDLIRAENMARNASLSFIPAQTTARDLNTRKRKSPDPDPVISAPSTSVIPPWRQKPALAERMDTSGQIKKQKKIDAFRADAAPSKFNDLEKRRQRFEGSAVKSSYSPNYRVDSPPIADTGPIVGTSDALEKQYFRLTAPPKPETVRPLPVLKKAIEVLIKRWKEEHNYAYICDQFKSMRQDLTVQHIKNDFTVRVYEAHARIALEKGDLGEYNQCQTQLRGLYRQKLGGRPGEFTAYRILYFIHTCNRTGMNDMLADLTLADKKHPAIKHALEVRSALSRGNYHKFFKLFEDPPNMGGYLMDMFVARERVAAMAAICKSYKPDVKIDFLTNELAFENGQDCAQFLCEVVGEDLLENREDGPRFLTSKGFPAFDMAKQKAFAMVDIKGQI